MSQLENRQGETQFLGYDCGLPPSVVPDGGAHYALAELVREMQSEARPHPEEVMERFAAFAAAYIHGTAHAGVMLFSSKRGMRSSAATGGLPHLIDKIQEELGEGPALDALSGKSAVRVDDLEQETRWPSFPAAVVSETPVRSMLCLPIYTTVHNWGTLTLHSHLPYGFGDDAEELGAIVATHSALTLDVLHRNRQFRSALGSRDIIGQAKGILMERYEIGATAAFNLLTKVSQESGKPVVVIAKELIEAKPGGGR